MRTMRQMDLPCLQLNVNLPELEELQHREGHEHQEHQREEKGHHGSRRYPSTFSACSHSATLLTIFELPPDARDPLP